MNKTDDLLKLADAFSLTKARYWCHHDDVTEGSVLFARRELSDAIEQALAEAREAGQKDGIIKGAMYALDHKPAPDVQPVAPEHLHEWFTMPHFLQWQVRCMTCGVFAQQIEPSPEQPANLR